MEKKYIKEIPFIRSIACLLVVMVHVTAANYTSNGFSNSLSLYLNQFSRLGTPIFAVISAYLLLNSVIKNGFSLKRFFTSRTVKIVSPFIIWTFVYLWLITYRGGEIFTDFRESVNYFILGNSYSHLYFIVTVIHFYLIFPLLQLIRDRRLILLLFFISIPIQYIWLNKLYLDYTDVFGEFSYIIEHRSFILNWISYFMFGAVLAYYYDDILDLVRKYTWLFILLAGIVLTSIFIEIAPDQLFNSSRPANMVYIPLFVLFLLTISRLFITNKTIFKPFKIIGEYSMGIYLVHPLVLYFVKTNLPAEFLSAKLLPLTFLIVVLISAFIIKLISLIPKSTFIVPIPKMKK